MKPALIKIPTLMPEGWRKLRFWEILRQGDRFFSVSRQGWEDTQSSGVPAILVGRTYIRRK